MTPRTISSSAGSEMSVRLMAALPSMLRLPKADVRVAPLRLLHAPQPAQPGPVAARVAVLDRAGADAGAPAPRARRHGGGGGDRRARRHPGAPPRHRRGGRRRLARSHLRQAVHRGGAGRAALRARGLLRYLGADRGARALAASDGDRLPRQPPRQDRDGRAVPGDRGAHAGVSGARAGGPGVRARRDGARRLPAARRDHRPRTAARCAGTGTRMSKSLRRFLPTPGSVGYHALLASVALFILGPLGGITSAYMTFSLGFSVGGQVLAGILGSSVTTGYSAEGKHGANYIQTMAASVASMAGMGVLIQAMVWLGMPLPAPWKLGLYFGCVGMFGIGVGMLYTPILVDRLQLEFPSGHAVANILRALTDKRLLRRSIGKLGGGTAGGIALGALVSRVTWLGRIGISASTLGAGLIVGSRIGVPTLVMGAVGALLVPHLRAVGILGPHDPFRKIGFLVGLAMVFGAAVVDLAVIGREAARRLQARRGAPRAPVQSGGLSSGRLLAWVIVWGVALVLVATLLLHQPLGFILVAIALAFLFVFVNGISDGISDWNPISSAFVMAVLLMSALGLRSPTVAMTAGSILLISCTVGVEMQQDRSTGWRLGSDRAIQFRYQAVGIVAGTVLCIVLTQFFMNAYPVLRVDTFAHPEARVGV